MTKTEKTVRPTRKPIFTFLAAALVVLFLAVTAFAIIDARSKAGSLGAMLDQMMGLVAVVVLMCFSAPPAFVFSLIGRWRNERWRVIRFFTLLLSAAGVALMLWGWIDQLQRGG